MYQKLATLSPVFDGFLPGYRAKLKISPFAPVPTALRLVLINEALYRKVRMTKAVRSAVRDLDSALSSAKEPPPALWRSLGGKDLPQEFLSKGHRVGEVITFSGFTSTSETPDALYAMLSDVDFYMEETPRTQWQTDGLYKVVPTEDYIKGAARNVIFRIVASKAAPISTLRGRTTEEEWLLPRKSRFVIRKIHRNVSVGNLKNVRRSARAQIFELEEV